MTVHKLTAGDGYIYLTRQVAAHDATNRGFENLGAYYTEKGEAPGVWMGCGLDPGPDVVPLFAMPAAGEQISESQMLALFGEGRHPNADVIERAVLAEGRRPDEAEQASRLGKRFVVHEARSMFCRRTAGAFRDYNLTRGLPPDAPVPAPDRARMRTEIAAAMFAENYGRPPVDARELSGHLARITRQATTAVAGYDLTFSPVKSVSTLWALAPRPVAEQIERAHRDAVADTLAWLEDHAAYTRVGGGGVAQVEVRGLIAAAFTHRDSRSGDPDLHTHVAVSNKVQALDGRWLALDGRALYQNNVAASERYNTRIQALLTDRLGLEFAERPGTVPGKRPVREIVGIDGDLPRAWSSRRAVIDIRRGVLAAQFQSDHGRPPTTKEAVALAQQANLESRPVKHEPRSYAEQRASWRAEALTVLGPGAGPQQAEARLRYYLAGALRPSHGRRRTRRTPRRATRLWIEQTTDQVLHLMQSERATWQIHHVRAEAERQVRAAGIRYADVDRAVDAVVAEALAVPHSLPLTGRDRIREPVEPPQLRRADGTSVYTVAGAQLFTSAEVLAAEQAILAAAGRRDGRRVPEAVLDRTLREPVVGARPLNPGQAQLVRELASSGARVQLALAPAGTGKTTALRTLSRAWTAGGGQVVGLAPSAAAAGVLREGIGADTDTLAKLIWYLHHGGGPAWLEAIGPATLVLIDEAGMAGTTDLADAIDYILARGGSVRLIGDEQQLAAIGAGGVLRDLAEAHGAVSLSQVMRFVHPPEHPDAGQPNHAEAAASLALREGDPAAIGYYLDYGRVHVGDLAIVTSDAYTAWSADRAAGHDAVLLAPTRDLVTELNARARTDRLATTSGPVGREVHLVDGSAVSAGDTIITRRNDRALAVSASDWVKNGDRWLVTAVDGDGRLDVIRRNSGLRARLPADYVAAHVGLGYAATVHAAQGITADTCYTVATGLESRQLLYVAMTRGRHANHVFLTVTGDGNPHTVITRDALLPPTAGDILARILARDASPVSATSAQRSADAPALRLAAAVARYRHALDVAATDHLGADALARLDQTADETVPGLTRCPAYPTLRAHLALLAADGHSSTEALTNALRDGRNLADARDPAAVLDWRLDPTGHHSTGPGPLAWLPAVPTQLAVHPEWGHYLHERAQLITALAHTVANDARTWTPTEAPAWAARLVDHDQELVTDLAVWRAAHDIDPNELRPTGPAQPATADARAQRRLDQRVTRNLGAPGAATARWSRLAEHIDPRLTSDPYWPTLAEQLSTAERAGIDITGLVGAVAADRPLPDEHAAAALWWRLAAHLSPAALGGTAHTDTSRLRPEWTPVLTHLVGATAAARVSTGAAWPGLVAAVTHAQTNGWSAEGILSTAYELLHGGQPDDAPLHPGELATALAWRIGLLINTSPIAGSSAVAPGPADTSHLADSAPAPDEDWVTSLAEPPTREADEIAAACIPDPIGDAHTPNHAPENATAPAHPVNWVADDTEYDALYQYPASQAVPRARLLDLNQQAAEFYTDHYRGSWAPDYLAQRLGPNLAVTLETDDRFHLGYAPAGWTTLTTHLRRAGATDEEIIAAGLGYRARTGRVIDRFRDRLVFPITAPGHDDTEAPTTEIHGFIGRRNPEHDDQAGPKYLNTAETDLFIKGHELFGLHEARHVLAHAAAPVLVEGPLDALAVTLAGNGAYAGIAPMGTALTDAQTKRLRPYRAGRQAQVIVATDADRAGQQAAHRAFWRLAARGADPARLALPHGKDPADLLQSDGPAALRTALDHAGSLADDVIAARIARFADQLDTIEGRIHATRRAADVIAAMPPTTWQRRADQIAEQFGVAPSTAANAIIEASSTWDESPTGTSRRRIVQRLSGAALQLEPPMSEPTNRWAELVATLNPAIITDPHWPVLANHLDRAADAGIDVPARLALVTAQRPLSDEHPGRDLDLRLHTDVPNRFDQSVRPATPAAPPDRDAPHRLATGGAPARDGHRSSSAPNRTEPMESDHVRPGCRQPPPGPTRAVNRTQARRP